MTCSYSTEARVGRLYYTSADTLVRCTRLTKDICRCSRWEREPQLRRDWTLFRDIPGRDDTLNRLLAACGESGWTRAAIAINEYRLAYVPAIMPVTGYRFCVKHGDHKNDILQLYPADINLPEACKRIRKLLYFKEPVDLHHWHKRRSKIT